MKTPLLTFILLFSVLLGCEKIKVKDSSFDVSPKSIVLRGDIYATDSIKITFPGKWLVTVSPANNGWLTLDDNIGEGDGTVIVTAESPNAGTEDRTVELTVIPEGDIKPITVKVTQTPYVFRPFELLYGSEDSEEFYGTAFDPPGFISVGNKNSNFWMVGFLPNGTRRWEKLVDNATWASAIIPSREGGFLVVGFDIVRYGGYNTETDADIVLLKIDSDGNVIWRKTYGGSNEDMPTSIIATKDGNYIITGLTTSFDRDINNQHGLKWEITPDVWVIKVNSNGDIIWQKCFGSKGSEFGIGICNAADGGYVVGASVFATEVDGDLTAVSKNTDFWVFKISASGSMVWQKTFGGSARDNPSSMTPGMDNGFLIVGSTESKDGDAGPSKSLTDGLIVKVSETGSKVWSRNIGSSTVNMFRSIAAVGNSYVAAGAITELDGVGYDGWEANIGATGNLISEKRLGGSDFDEVRNVLNLGSGYYMLSGSSLSKNIPGTTHSGYSDGWLICKKK